MEGEMAKAKVWRTLEELNADHERLCAEAEAVKKDEKKRIVRKKAGFKRAMVELTEKHYDELAKLAVADIRRGGPTEMLSVLVRLNLDTLIKNHRPAQAPLIPEE